MASTNKIVTQTNLLNVRGNAFVNGTTRSFDTTSVAIRNNLKKVYDKETDDEIYTIEETLTVDQLQLLLAQSIRDNLTINVDNFVNYPTNYYYAVLQDANAVSNYNFATQYLTTYMSIKSNNVLSEAIYFTVPKKTKGVMLTFYIRYQYTPDDIDDPTSPFPPDFNFEDYILFDFQKVTSPGPTYVSIPGTITIDYKDHKIYQTPTIKYFGNKRFGTLNGFVYEKIFDTALEPGEQFIAIAQFAKKFKTEFNWTSSVMKFTIYYVI